MKWFKLRLGGFNLVVYRRHIWVTIHRFYGILFGIEWKPGPWRDSPLTHSTLRLYFFIWCILFDHKQTEIS